jgi:ligand-binding sensor domain-containing protein
LTRGAQLAALAIALCAHDAVASRSFARFGAGRGLDAAVAVTMLVDRKGLLWVGSREGLYRYDGYHAEAFLPDTARPGTISDADVRRIFEAGDGSLWVATNTGGLNRRDPGSGDFTQFHHDSAAPDSLSDESVYGLAEDAEGRLWVGTQHGLNRLQPDGRTFARCFHRAGDPASLAADWVYALHRGPSGQLWVGTVGGGLDRWAGAERGFDHFPLAKLAGGPRELNDVFALHEAPDGRVWAGTRAGLVVLDPARRRAERFDLGAGQGEQPLVTAMHADRTGQLWVATVADGVFRVDPASGRWSRAHPGPPGASGNLPAFATLSLAATDHVLFAGTWGGGVYRAPLEEPEFRFVTRAADGSAPVSPG